MEDEGDKVSSTASTVEAQNDEQLLKVGMTLSVVEDQLKELKQQYEFTVVEQEETREQFRGLEKKVDMLLDIMQKGKEQDNTWLREGSKLAAEQVDVGSLASSNPVDSVEDGSYDPSVRDDVSILAGQAEDVAEMAGRYAKRYVRRETDANGRRPVYTLIFRSIVISRL